MDILDGIIVVVTGIGVYAGYRRGGLWVGLGIIGIIAGVAVGALIAPTIGDWIGAKNPALRTFSGSVIFLIIVLITHGIGTAIGFGIRTTTLKSHTKWVHPDSVVGAVLSATAILAASWYLGLTFSGSRIVVLDGQIHNSFLERAMDRVEPRPPGALANLSSLFTNSDFPTPFSAVYQTLLPPVNVPNLNVSPQVTTVQQATVKVVSDGCGGLIAGSGWPVASDYIVTDAHVVAGGTNTTVALPSGRQLNATVVLFDPSVDLAVLYVPALHAQPLTIASSNPQRAATGVVVGYPGGGSERLVPAAVRAVEDASGEDIYNSAPNTREIEVLAVSVVPGNSGGPFVSLSGVVQGIVFATNTDNPAEGYALTPSQILPDINEGIGRTAGVSTQSCALL